ncbi:facilitated trehalose transporter Tret1-2 homolog [Trichogramma pretiosum]|uniref:facilitated trehalose transporter Tret1-2 homolog n=1 Tax=Trichogramma pretiosum TaxID=7493 RepID=UPI000C719951|nr:facilitated trehalose transporter Tret1-2 homolog [Trichogramma pretiosum]
MESGEFFGCAVGVKEEPTEVSRIENDCKIIDEKPDLNQMQCLLFSTENSTQMYQEFDVNCASNKKIDDDFQYHMQYIKDSDSYETKLANNMETVGEVKQEISDDFAVEPSFNHDGERNEDLEIIFECEDVKLDRDLLVVNKTETMGEVKQEFFDDAAEKLNLNLDVEQNNKKSGTEESMDRDNPQNCDKRGKTSSLFSFMAQIGISIGWPSPNVPRLQQSGNHDTLITATDDELSWIVSVIGLGAVAGALAGSCLVELLGSRRTLLLALLIEAADRACLVAATSASWIIASRALGGLSAGLAYGAFALYLGEVGAPECRGTLVSIASAGIPLGILVGTCAESYLPARLSSSLYLAMCAASIGLFAWLRDTPYHLMRAGREPEAEKSVILYYPDVEAKQKMSEIRDFLESKRTDRVNKWREMTRPVSLKSFAYIVALYSLPNLTGLMIVQSYMEVILAKTSRSIHVESTQQLVIGANAISSLATLATVNLVDRLGRRPLLMVSGCGCALANAGLAAAYFHGDADDDVDNLGWLTPSCVVAYLVFYAIGLARVPNAVLSEICGDGIKGAAGCLASLCGALSGFAVLRSYRPLADELGDQWVFCGLVAFSSLCVPLALLLPETKGKSLNEIQNMLRRK